jgi:hypothetical protein
MEYNWRLVYELVAYLIYETREVYFVAPEKKSYQSAVLKLMPSQVSYEEVYLTQNSFNLKLMYDNSIEKIDLYVKSDLFSVDDWFRVANFESLELGNILTQSTCKNGIFDEAFEAAFCEGTPKITFIHNGMLKYPEYEMELSRRLNCELHKKTTKWEPGHRYDTLKESFYFLCSVQSRKDNRNNSYFLTDESSMPVKYLYVNNIKPEDKTISDILNRRSFGVGPYDIKVLDSKTSSVDVGEVLKDDFTNNIQDYWDTIFNNSIQYTKVVSETGFETYKNLLSIFEIFTFQSPLHTEIKISESIKLELELIIKSLVHKIILDNWNNSTGLTKDKSAEDNMKEINRLFYYCIDDPNFLRSSYYPHLFDKLGLKLPDLIAEVYNSWSENSLYINFDTYYKYLFYQALRFDPSKNVSTQRINSTNYKLEVTTIEDLYSDKELADIIKKVYNDARQSFGIGVSSFEVINIGTKKSPKEYIHCEITLVDIINYLTRKGESEVPETLKNEILSHKFYKVIINIDKDGVIK